MERHGLLTSLFPGLAARYWASRARVAEMQRLYDLASAKSQARYPLLGGRGYSGDAVISNVGTRLRDYARHLDENSDIAAGILNTLVDQVAPLDPEPMVSVAGRPAEEVNDRLAELWKRWTRGADVAGVLPWGELKRVAARTLYRDGEVFVRPIEGAAKGAVFGALPFALQILEPDLCPMEMIEEQRGIVHGIRVNRWGRPTAYWIYRRHPGGVLPHVAPALLDDGRFIPAEQLWHLKHARRLPQLRGVSIFAPAATRLLDLKHYEESERVAARVAASFSAVIKRQPMLGQTPAYTPDGSARAIELQPGMILDELGPGEDIQVVNTTRPNTGLEQFRNAMLRSVATGTGASYSTISKDYSGTYSSQRQELVEQQPRYAGLREYWIAAFLEPVYRRFVQHAVLAGEVVAPGIELEDLSRATYTGATVPWIDPAKEVTADRDAVEAGFKSRAQVIRERGGDRRMVDAERAQDTQPGTSRAALRPVEEDDDDDEQLEAAAEG